MQDDDAGVSLAKDPPQYAQRSAEDQPLETFLTVGAYGMLGLLGLIMGAIGAFGYGWTLGSVPVAALVLVVLNFGLVWLAGWGMGGRIGAAVPWVAWTSVVLVLSAERSEGDLIIAGDSAGYLFIVGGMVAGGLAIAVTRSPRAAGSWLTGPGARSLR